MPSSLPADEVAQAIRALGLTIYSAEATQDSPAYYSNTDLEDRLLAALRGKSLAGLPLRTRSKVAKSLVCEALGYPVPGTFRKTQPRFPSLNVDLYVQKADNLQIWNEELAPDRRYVVLRLNLEDVIVGVRVATGQELALLDKTGTLTSKYQANRISPGTSKLVVSRDTDAFIAALDPVSKLIEAGRLSPVAPPRRGSVLSISALYDQLQPLLGRTIDDPGATSERLRGVSLQREVCNLLGLGRYADAGQFPDVLCQALEVKLQLSRTVDLGLISPDDARLATELEHGLRYCDARYAIVYADRMNESRLVVTDIVVTTGQRFFEEFRRFEGNVQNRKLQIRLPNEFFRIV
jgi:hypothetical protein